MEPTLLIASLLTAFIAGIAALFAPCCITVLLPTYLGSIFRQKKKVIAMTFVFFLGLLAVFMPLGLGFASLGTLFSEYHDLIFILGGIFLLLLGASILLGFHFSFSFTKHPKSKITGPVSVFTLGIFSAIATLCCAPVLAGVLALSILPGSLFWGGLYSFLYVAGMIAPLFVVAFFMDKYDLTSKFEKLSQSVSYKVFGREINVSSAELISGIMFLGLGILIIYLAKAGKLAMGNNTMQTSINIFMSNLTTYINESISRTSGLAWIIISILIPAFAIYKYGYKSKGNGGVVK